jgi:hypothetical protein
MRGENHIFLKNRSILFLRTPLERADHIGAVGEIGFLVHVFFERYLAAHRRHPDQTRLTDQGVYS